ASFAMSGRGPDRKETPDEPAVFSSIDQGISWQFLNRPITDRSGSGLFIYPTLLLLPEGRLQCYAVHLDRKSETVDGLRNAMCVVTSTDNGKTWSEPVVITGKGAAAWKNPGTSGHMYRSPWPILLKDGRILVLFARR